MRAAETVSFAWVLTRAEHFGWTLQKIQWRSKRVFHHGHRHSPIVVEVVNGRVERRRLQLFVEWVRENCHGEEFFDGTEN